MPDEPYRAPRPIEPDPYAKAWADLRRRRMVAIGLFPLLLILLGVATAQRRSRQPGGFGVLAIVLVTLIPVFRLLAFRCPQCRDYFTSPRSSRVVGFLVNPRATPGPFNQRCYSCGVAAGTPRSAAVEAETRSITESADS